jgi:hypothetical protein
MNEATWDDMIGKWYSYEPYKNFEYVCYVVDSHDPIVSIIELSKERDKYKDSANMGNIYDYRSVKPAPRGFHRAIKAVFN